MPLLAGMVIGRMMGGGGYGYYRGTGYYRDRVGRFTTPYGGGLFRSPNTGRLQVARGAVEPAAPRYRTPSTGRSDNRAVSRGGFRSTRSYAGRGYGG
jgi:uncharacterized protein YgiB involved in biofilm formation